MKRLLYIGIILLFATNIFAAKKKKAEPKRTDQEIVREQELKYYFYQGVQCFDQAEYDQALALFLHCSYLNPNDAATCSYLAKLHGGLGRSDAALYYADKAYKGAPVDYWQLYVNTHLQRGTAEDIRLSLTALEYVSKYDQNNSDIFELRQKIYTYQKNSKMALKMQDELDRIDGPTAYGAATRYEIYMNLGKKKQAYDALEEYLEYDPAHDYMQVYVADLYWMDGQKEKALERYQQIVADYPNNPYVYASLSDYYGREGKTDLAAEYEMKAIENDGAWLEYKLDVLNKYRWLDEDSLTYKALLSLVEQYPQEEQAIHALGRYYIEHNQHQEAKQALWTVLDIDQKNAEAWKELRLQMNEDSTTTDIEREEMLRKAISAMPDDRQWYVYMSLLMMRKEMPDSAIWYCKEGLRIPDTETNLIYKVSLNAQLGDLYCKNGQADSAFVCYEEALKIAPESAYILNNYAYFLAINGGSLDKAEKMSQMSIKQEPKNATYLDTYAWILHLKGQDGFARFYMQQAWDNMDKDTEPDPDLLEHYNIIFDKKDQ